MAFCRLWADRLRQIYKCTFRVDVIIQFWACLPALNTGNCLSVFVCLCVSQKHSCVFCLTSVYVTVICCQSQISVAVLHILDLLPALIKLSRRLTSVSLILLCNQPWNNTPTHQCKKIKNLAQFHASPWCFSLCWWTDYPFLLSKYVGHLTGG